MTFIITYWCYKTKTAKSDTIVAQTYDELLEKVKDLMWDYGELISITRKF